MSLLKSPVARVKEFRGAGRAMLSKRRAPGFSIGGVRGSAGGLAQAAQAALRVSEIRYRRLFEAARDGVLLLDPGTRKITDVNPFMIEFLGYAYGEFVGKELWEIGLLKDRQASRKMFRELRENHFIRYEHLPLKSTRGRTREVEVVANLYKEGAHPVIQCNIRDITDRKAIEDQVRVSECRYRRLFEAARDGILLLDPETRKITDANPFMSELLGYPHEDLLDKELWEIGLLKDEKASREAFRELQQKHFIRYEDLPLQNKKGQRREVEFVSNLYEEAGRMVIQCNIRDITERKRVEQTLLNAKNELDLHAAHLEQVVTERTGQLRETIGELEGFSYSVSHDMRAPLRAMQSFASYLVDEYSSKLDEQGVNYLHQIMRSAIRLDRLIQDVLSYTRILHSPLPMERVNLDRLVRDIIEIYPNGQPIKPQIKIKGKLPKVMGNEALLTQCVSNLLSNGAKFVAPGTTPHLEVWAEVKEKSMVRVWFKDNGIGIAPENHERIFRLFARIHPTAAYEGTGIGLTIVRKSIERMGAQVGFESKVGKGSRFWIQLEKG